jgi:hypothetical protein
MTIFSIRCIDTVQLLLGTPVIKEAEEKWIYFSILVWSKGTISLNGDGTTCQKPHRD